MIRDGIDNIYTKGIIWIPPLKPSTAPTIEDTYPSSFSLDPNPDPPANTNAPSIDWLSDT